MSRRKATRGKALKLTEDRQAEGDGGTTPARVLLVEPDAGARKTRARLLRGTLIQVDPVGSLREAMGAAGGCEYDAALIREELEDGSGLDLAHHLAQAGASTGIILLSQAPTMELAVSAMRTGALDLLSAGAAEAELLASVSHAIERGRSVRGQREQLDRLKRVCRRLNRSRRQVSDQIDSLCNDLVGAYQELADHVTHVAMASEFSSLLSQELDVESLLRTTLEYLLTKTGPTNAAVFLPSNHCDFSLGAYVNYNCSRDAADVLLDHLADVIAPRFQDEPGIVVFNDDDDLVEGLGEDAHWLADSRVVVFACRHEGEALAVITLFRDRVDPFSDELLDQIDVLRGIFAEGLARVIRVHHRHLPEDQWSGWDPFGEEDDEDEGWGGGSGGIAA